MWYNFFTFLELLDVEKFGYITTDKALMNCEEGIRETVETEIQRYSDVQTIIIQNISLLIFFS